MANKKKGGGLSNHYLPKEGAVIVLNVDILDQLWNLCVQSIFSTSQNNTLVGSDVMTEEKNVDFKGISLGFSKRRGL